MSGNWGLRPPEDALENEFRQLVVSGANGTNFQNNQQSVTGLPLYEIGMKRERQEQDDDPVMPLSKRMNNIHFDRVVAFGNQPQFSDNNSPGEYLQTVPRSARPTDGMEKTSGYAYGQNGHHSRAPPEDPCSTGGLNSIQYSPPLSREENPIYYDQNKALFDLYKQRLERNNYPPHPNFGNR